MSLEHAAARGPAGAPPLSLAAQAFLDSTSPRYFGEEITPLTVHDLRMTAAREAGPVVALAESMYSVGLTWQRAGDVEIASFHPLAASRVENGDYLVYVHGGAFIFGSGDDVLARACSHYLGLAVHSIHYDLAPEAVYPRALEQCLAAWAALTDALPGRPVLVGVSSGGNLCLALLHRLLQDPQRYTLPAMCLLASPWVDLSLPGGVEDPRWQNEGRDPIIRWANQLDRAAHAYAAGADISSPLLSPINGGWDGLSVPTLITTGTRDLFYADCRRLQSAMRRDGVPVTLDVGAGLWHTYQAELDLPETLESWSRISGYVSENLR